MTRAGAVFTILVHNISWHVRELTLQTSFDHVTNVSAADLRKLNCYAELPACLFVIFNGAAQAWFHESIHTFMHA
jgi:hypothetical protein